MHVAISYASRRAEADAAADEIRQLGRKALALRCNVAVKAEVDELVRRTRADLGPIDFLAHCGAISNIADHSELSYERWREMIDVNLNGAYLAIFAVKDEMIRRKFGRIVMISSIAALLPRKMQIHYASSKAGVMALSAVVPTPLRPTMCASTASLRA